MADKGKPDKFRASSNYIGFRYSTNSPFTKKVFEPRASQPLLTTPPRKSTSTAQLGQKTYQYSAVKNSADPKTNSEPIQKYGVQHTSLNDSSSKYFNRDSASNRLDYEGMRSSIQFRTYDRKIIEDSKPNIDSTK